MLTHDNQQCASICFFAGVARPPTINLSSIELYGFSEYWYSLYDVLGLGGRYNYSLFTERAREYCAERWSTIMLRSRKHLYMRADDERLRTQCFKSAWVSAVLHDGFGIDRWHNSFSTVFNINDQEVQWTIGAMLYNMRYFPLRYVFDDTPTILVRMHFFSAKFNLKIWTRKSEPINIIIDGHHLMPINNRLSSSASDSYFYSHYDIVCDDDEILAVMDGRRRVCIDLDRCGVI